MKNPIVGYIKKSFRGLVEVIGATLWELVV